MTDRLAAALAELAEAIRAEVRAETSPSAVAALLSIDETAARLGLGRSKVYALIAGGELASLSVGRRRLVSSAVVAAFIAERAA